MFNKLYIILFFSVISITNAQELNCNLVINAEQTGRQNLQVFQTLETALNDFINKTAWTNKVFLPHERINCSMMITITSFDVDRFSATLQVQASRPIYNSTYSSPILNYNDRDFNFEYIEFQNMTFNPNQFDSNLISVVSFYAYIILGIDADSYKLNGGTEYFNQAKNILNVAQSSSYKGWNPIDGPQTRFQLIDQVLEPGFKEYRNVMYTYHRTALDEMSDNQKKSKQRITIILDQLKKLNARKPNSFLLRTFFDAKADEIVEIFSSGPSVKITEMVEVLNRVSPGNISKWNNIKF